MTSRRSFLRLGIRSSLSIAFATTIPPARRAAAEEEAFAQDPKTIAAWMDEWMVREKAATGVLYVGRFLDPVWFLTRTITWTPNADQAARLPTVEVPVGFVTDFASIPRPFWSLLRPDGNYAWASVIHDYLYWMQKTSRTVADEIFKIAMQDFSIDAVTIATIYNAVRFGGDSAWSGNAKLKAAGEKRILKLFPPDPTVSWADWKRRSDVFEP